MLLAVPPSWVYVALCCLSSQQGGSLDHGVETVTLYVPLYHSDVNPNPCRMSWYRQDVRKGAVTECHSNIVCPNGRLRRWWLSDGSANLYR